MTVREFFPAAAGEVVRMIEHVHTDELTAATPCTELDLKGLVNHFTGTTAALARVGDRLPLDPDDPYGSQQDPSRGDWRQVLAGNVTAVARAWERPEAWDGTVEMGGPPMPAPMIGEMALAEILLHGWDLARATGQQLSVSDEVGSELLRAIEETAELGRTMGAYGPEVSVDRQATPFERALGASGRDPRWQAA